MAAEWFVERQPLAGAAPWIYRLKQLRKEGWEITVLIGRDELVALGSLGAPLAEDAAAVEALDLAGPGQNPLLGHDE